MLLLLGLALAQPRVPTAGREGESRFVRVGEALGPAVVERVEVHREFERLHLRVGEEALAPVELVPERPDREGLCAAHGWTVFPRWELRGEAREDAWRPGEGPPRTDEERAHEAICARLAERGEALRSPPPSALGDPGPGPDEERGPALRWRPIVIAALPGLILPLALLLGLLGLRGADRRLRVELLLLTLAAALPRLLRPAGIFNGDLAGYEKLAIGLGLKRSPSLYGEGFAALHAPAVALFGAHPAVLFETHRLLSVLSPALLLLALRRAAGPPAALLAALALALHPAAIRLGPTEEMGVPTLALLLLAAAGLAVPSTGARASRGGRVAGLGALLAGLAGGFALHLRPEALLLLPALIALALLHDEPLPRRLARLGLLALPLLPLLALRLLDLPDPGAVALDPRQLLDPTFLLGALRPRLSPDGGAHHLAFDPRWTSPLLPLGALLALRRGRAALPWLLWLLPATALVVKSWPLADGLRLQLYALAGWAALSGLGLGPLLGARGPRWLLALALLLPPLLTARFELLRHAEWRWLARTLPTAAAGAELLVPGREDRAAAMGLVLEALAPGLRTAPAVQGGPREGRLLLEGSACLEGRPEENPPDCAGLRGRCRSEVVAEAWVVARTDLDTEVPLDRQDRGLVPLRLLRLLDCQEGS